VNKTALGGLVFTILTISGLVLFSNVLETSARHQDDIITQNLKAKIQDASPLLDTGLVSTPSKDYRISNQFEIRHIWPGELMRMSGVTVDGYPFYAIHKMNFNDIEISGTILVGGKTIPIIKNIVVEESPIVIQQTVEEPIVIVEEDPIPIKAVILQPHTTYWRGTYNINIKVFEADQNSQNNYWYREYLVPDVPVSVQINHEDGNLLTILNGKTDQNGHFEGQYFITENIVKGGKYLVEVIVGDETVGYKQNLVTFITPIIPGLLSSGDKAPVAVAGNDQNVFDPVNVILDGTGSFDPDGDPITSYQWTRVSGPVVVINDAGLAIANFDTAGVGIYVFELAVTASGKTGTDQITINVT